MFEWIARIARGREMVAPGLMVCCALLAGLPWVPARAQTVTITAIQPDPAAPGATVTVDFQVSVDPAPDQLIIDYPGGQATRRPPFGPFTFAAPDSPGPYQVNVVGTCQLSPCASDTATFVVEAPPAGAELTVQKTTALESFTAGASVDFEITLRNDGDADARAVRLTEQPGAGLLDTTLTALSGGDCQGPRCDVDLPAGQTASFRVSARVAADLTADTQVCNSASVRWDTGSGGSGAASDRVCRRVTVVEQPNQPPRALIVEPDGAAPLPLDTPVTFSAMASDPEDDAAGLPLDYRWRFGGCADPAAGATVAVRFPTALAGAGCQVLLTVTDSAGASTSASLDIMLEAAVPPRPPVAVTLTRLGAAQRSLPLGTDASFQVRLIDAEGAPLAGTVPVLWRLVIADDNLAGLFQGDDPDTSLFGGLRGDGGTLARLDRNGVAELQVNATGGIASVGFVGAVLPSRYTLTAVEQTSGEERRVDFAIQAGLERERQSGTPEAAMLGVIDILCPRMAGLDELAPEQQELLTRCSTLVGADQGTDAGADAVTRAAREMAPEELAAQSRMGLSMANQQLFNITGRLARLRGGGVASALSDFHLNIADARLPGELFSRALGSGGGASDDGNGLLGNGWGVFITGDVFLGDRDRTTQEAGFEFETLGLTAGIDRRINDDLILGAAVGYAATDADVDDDGGGSEVDGFTVTLYGNYYLGDSFYVDGTLAYGWQDFDTDRRIRYTVGDNRVDTVAGGGTDGRQFTASFGAGYDLALDNGITVGLNGRVSYLDGEIDGYREEDENRQGLNLDYQDQSYESLTLTLGGSVSRALSYEWGVLVPEFRFEWEHEFEDDPVTIQGHFVNDPAAGWAPVQFAFDTERFDSNYFRLGLGASAVLGQGRQWFVYYEHLLGYDDLSQGRISGGLRLEW